MSEVHFHRGLLIFEDKSHHEAFQRAIPLARWTKALLDGMGPRWFTAPTDAPAVVQWADAHRKTVDKAVRAYADQLWVHELEALSVTAAASLSQDKHVKIRGLTSTLLETQQVVPYAAQRAHVRLPETVMTHRALLVADEPGLGKTIQSLASLRTEGVESQRAVVICPTSLTANWVAEMSEHFAPGTFTPWVATSQTPKPIPEGTDTVVIGWEILSHWSDALIKWDPDAVVADEGHYGKAGKQQVRTKKETVQKMDANGESVRDEAGNLVFEQVKSRTITGGSARATAQIAIGEKVAKNHGLVMILTGTPILNRPQELEALLEFLGILPLFGGSKSYKERYCGPKWKKVRDGRQQRDYSGASHLMELNKRLTTSGHYVRRKKELLIDAGLLQRKYVDGVYAYDYTTRPNPWIVHATPQEMAPYQQAEEDLAGFFAMRAAEIAAEIAAGRREPVSADLVRRKVVAEGHKHLQRIAVLRQEAAMIKAPYVVQRLQPLIGQGEKVVIAAHHRDVVDFYADAFTGVKIQGSMGVKKIEEAKALFNETPASEHPVLVLSVEAGKTGHTLCKQALHGVGKECAYLVFAEQVWTPGDEAQVQDRIWRIGQSREVRIINALLAGSIDQSMFIQRVQKRAVLNQAIDAVPGGGAGVVETPKEEKEAEKEGAGQLAWHFAQRGMQAQRQSSAPTR